MPKAPRKPEVVETMKNTILEHAVKMMTSNGYEGFSMRKLAEPLQIAAKTIYNYYRNKDELYLAILTKGFERLYEQSNAAYMAHQDPYERMDAMLEAYLNFGLEEANFYNLMFTWHVPKYNDYVGTIMEPTARMELAAALRCPELFVKAVKKCVTPGDSLPDEKARLIIIHSWTQLHGFIAGYNNTILDYMHEEPISLKPYILDKIKQSYRNELKNQTK